MALPGLFYCPAGLPFVDVLAAGIRAQVGDDPLALADVTVLLPTRRACRALREAFLRHSGGVPLLLPRLVPVGELDADELGLSGGDDLPGASDLPPPIPPLRRQVLLTALIARAADFAATPAQAAALAGALGRLLDEIHVERLDVAALAGLVPDRYAAHWQRTLKFLELITAVWPAILADQGALDSAAWRNQVLDLQAQAWCQHPPTGWVIAAGITGSVPAVADLLAVVANLPQGTVVLPGLDQTLDEAAWAVLDETHPQYALRHTLEQLQSVRANVRPWPHTVPILDEPARHWLWAEVMRPAAASDQWRSLADQPPPPARCDAALAGLRLIEADGPQQEAQAIALLLRGALEQPSRTAALVTPDRTLARRVVTTLERWGIEVDDSAGLSLPDTPVGAFLRLTAELLTEAAAPIPLLSALKQPFFALGHAADDTRRIVRRLERLLLRGPRPGAGLDGLRAALKALSSDALPDDSERAGLLAWIDRLIAVATPFYTVLHGPAVPFAEHMRAHLAFAEALAATDTQTGPDRLWQDQDGIAAARFAAELLDAVADFPAIEGRDYPAMLGSFMAQVPVRRPFGLHPRLFIWGPLEARLQQCDLMVLGGLNEGSWPPSSPADPWLSRPMRRDFGLPVPEARVGRSAHDFLCAACGHDVVLTRARRVDGVPTVPSRWLLRLNTVLTALGTGLDRVRAPAWTVWADWLDRPAKVIRNQRPAPAPPLEQRPRSLSVTEIEVWQTNPYAIYAKHVLKLSALDPIDADPGAAERGQIVHAALEKFVVAYPDRLPTDAGAILRQMGREAFGTHLAQPDVAAFWWPRFERVVEWFLQQEAKRRDSFVPVGTESEGRITLAGGFTLRGRADRIDRTRGGQAVAILDYKTGTAPSLKAVKAGQSPQLPLLGLIAQQGGFAGLGPAVVAELAYWQITGGATPGKIVSIFVPGGDPESVELVKSFGGDPDPIAAAADGLERLIAAYDDPTTPYPAWPHPDRPPRFDDYAHLARVKAWAGASEGDGG